MLAGLFIAILCHRIDTESRLRAEKKRINGPVRVASPGANVRNCITTGREPLLHERFPPDKEKSDSVRMWENHRAGHRPLEYERQLERDTVSRSPRPMADDEWITMWRNGEIEGPRSQLIFSNEDEARGGNSSNEISPWRGQHLRPSPGLQEQEALQRKALRGLRGQEPSSGSRFLRRLMYSREAEELARGRSRNRSMSPSPQRSLASSRSDTRHRVMELAPPRRQSYASRALQRFRKTS